MLMTTAMIWDGHTMDFTARVQMAQRADGAWFKRVQERSRWGYRWTRWTACRDAPRPGFSEGSRVARLPKGPALLPDERVCP